MTKRVVRKGGAAAEGKAKAGAGAVGERAVRNDSGKSGAGVNGAAGKKAAPGRRKSAAGTGTKKTTKASVAKSRKKVAKAGAVKGVEKAKKTTSKSGAQSAGKSVRKMARGKNVKAAKAKSGGSAGGGAAAKGKKTAAARIWLTRNEALDALKKDGASLSQKCLYANYGPSSSAPVRRKGDLWHYPELLERVKLNRNKSEIDYDSINKVSLARQAAELRIKEAKAEFEEIKLRRQAGELIEKVAVEQVLRTAAVELETNRKAMVADLTARIMNMLPRSCKKHEMDIGNVLERASRGWLEGLSGKFADMEMG